MDWSHLQQRIPYEKNFRWRGGQVSRIEAFADAVFALSVTMLVVSTQVPASYVELIAILKAFPAFALSFVLVLLAWYFHFIHFRRYGLEDVTTMFLNLALLFVVLYYVYPLRFMMAFLQEWAMTDLVPAATRFGVDEERVGRLLAIYGVGFVLMYVILGLMALHALRLREQLELNEVEVVMTRSLITTHGIQAGVGVLSVALAVFLPAPYKGFGGFAYMLLPFLHPLHGVIATRQEKAALARMAEGGDPTPASRVEESGPPHEAPVSEQEPTRPSHEAVPPETEATSGGRTANPPDRSP